MSLLASASTQPTAALGDAVEVLVTVVNPDASDAHIVAVMPSAAPANQLVKSQGFDGILGEVTLTVPAGGAISFGYEFRLFNDSSPQQVAARIYTRDGRYITASTTITVTPSN